MLHPDYQYTPLLVTAMAQHDRVGVYDLALGSRILGNGALRGGMPLYKYLANRALTLFQNLMMGAKLSEYHTGFRAFSRELLEALPLMDQLRRFRFRQPDARASGACRRANRRNLLPDAIFPGGILHQFPAQRDLRARRGQEFHRVSSATHGRSPSTTIFSDNDGRLPDAMGAILPETTS